MLTPSRALLRGHNTLVASWQALTRLSPGARIVRTQSAVAAVFPAWVPLNNAILLDEPGSVTAAAAAIELKHLYESAGVESWAMWLPSAATSFDDPDELTAVGGMQRDTTTLVMELTLAEATSRPEGFVRTSVEVAARAGDEPVPDVQLPDPDDGNLDAWVLVREGLAVVGAWSVIDGTDCGIYAVGTVPEWRGRGLATDLMRGVLGDAVLRGARTATLQSTRMGVPLYRSLGFEPVGRYDEWVPAAR